MWFKTSQKKRLQVSQNNLFLLKANQDGLTLIECLVAIAMIASSVAIITPAVVVAVATRVQNQRAEQAFQTAQAEVDRVKLIIERGGTYELNIASTAATVSTASEFESEVDPPEDIDDTTFSTTLDAAKPIDIDGDGTTDFAAQIFRTQGKVVGTQPVAFDLGVRVYRADVVDSKDADELETDQAALTFTSGEGKAGSYPLAVIYTSIMKSDTENSLCDYFEYVNSTTGTTTSTPSQC